MLFLPGSPLNLRILASCLFKYIQSRPSPSSSSLPDKNHFTYRYLFSPFKAPLFISTRRHLIPLSPNCSPSPSFPPLVILNHHRSSASDNSKQTTNSEIKITSDNNTSKIHVHKSSRDGFVPHRNNPLTNASHILSQYCAMQLSHNPHLRSRTSALLSQRNIFQSLRILHQPSHNLHPSYYPLCAFEQLSSLLQQHPTKIERVRIHSRCSNGTSNPRNIYHKPHPSPV